MCGIFALAYYNKDLSRRHIIDTLLRGLQMLEYRGYDSAGVCFDERGCHSLPVIIKKEGKITALDEEIRKYTSKHVHHASLRNGVALGHTRWATHGDANDVNAHPIASDDAHQFVIVHNGVVNNFGELKLFLSDKQVQFFTQTDTEVIVKLFHLIYKENPSISFSALAKDVTQMIDGALSFVVKSNAYFPGELVAANRGSSLAYSISFDSKEAVIQDKNVHSHDGRSLIEPTNVIIASDVSAIVEHCQHVNFLESNEVLHVSQQGIVVLSNGSQTHRNTSVTRASMLLKDSLSSYLKGPYDHYMLKEIFEQDRCMQNSMRGRLVNENGELGGIREHMHRLHAAKMIFLVGCGSSYHACMAVRSAMEYLLCKTVVVFSAGDFSDTQPILTSDYMAIFVSQSGETADVLQALSYCEGRTDLLVGFTNVASSTLSRRTLCGAHINAGPEMSVASTKSYTSQIIVLLLFACMLSQPTRIEKRSKLVSGLRKVPEVCKEFLKTIQPQIEELAKDLAETDSLFIMGRGHHWASALEGALKIKEVSYIHAEAFHASEIKHGPIALIQKNTVMLCILGLHDFEKTVAAIQQVRARGARVIAVAPRGAKVQNFCDGVIEYPSSVDCLECVFSIVPFQLLAYHIALLRGNDIDQPRNLAKCVTVE